MKEVVEIYYVADDGKRFEDEVECAQYELMCKYENIWAKIEIYDKYGTRLDEPFDDWTYQRSWTIIIHDKVELKAFKEIAEFNGWSLFEEVNKPGTWEWLHHENWLEDGFALVKGVA